MLIRVKDNPRHMSEQEEKYWLHVLSGDPMFKNFIQRQSMFGDNPYQTAARQPICPKCERAGFFHENGMACHHCGYTGSIEHNLKIHIREGHFR